MPVLLSRADAADVHVSSTRIAVFAGCQNTKVISTQLAVPLPAPATSPLASSKLGAASLASTTPPITPTIPTVKWHVHSAHYGYVYSVALRQLGEPVCARVDW